ncbi:MAG: DJ-1/PfpI family protein [Candidatus Thiodiazotropha sp. (ex. Lucinisca nassula)]|nr:DJ-1/PfpI family protein [Candidatus Thiodiazotropha sp. (ex. Lucinisca nassula)]MBW9275315.1 DJ-1/PfpI family protein [Candidatus Thiodiazotropha sp. (ex. Lucinisca nassula)]
MSKKRRIIFIVYHGIELLDVAGPAAVFSAANAISGGSLYSIKVVSPVSGSVLSNSGLSLSSEPITGFKFTASDTVFVVGAYERELVAAMKDTTIQTALQTASRKAERYGSICTGAFVLGKTGLLEGKRATTHWAGRERLGKLFKDLIVDADALYVKDGKLWTSAGVAAGIDMALAVIESDHGALLKSKVAKQLVVYSHRPGYQSQFSELLAAQVKADERYSALVDWLSNRLDKTTKVSEMAEYLGMSERSFYRHFTKTFNQTPSKFLEQLKLEAGKNLIEAGQPINIIASSVGFRSESAFRSAFKTQFGVTPTLYAQMHC